MFEEIAYLLDLQVIKTGREKYNARWQRESKQESLQRWVEANKMKFKDDRGVLHFKSQRNGNIWAGWRRTSMMLFLQKMVVLAA